MRISEQRKQVRYLSLVCLKLTGTLLIILTSLFIFCRNLKVDNLNLEGELQDHEWYRKWSSGESTQVSEGSPQIVSKQHKGIEKWFCFVDLVFRVM